MRQKSHIPSLLRLNYNVIFSVFNIILKKLDYSGKKKRPNNKMMFYRDEPRDGMQVVGKKLSIPTNLIDWQT